MLKLYDYWRSSAAYRLRIALNLKGIPYESAVVDIKPGQDEQRGGAYARINPQMRVPSIELDGRVSGQSMAILEWIEETYDGPSLLPEDAWMRLRCRAFADVIACDVHPLNNLSVLSALKTDFGADQEAVTHWYHDWIRRGFDALELLANELPKAGFLFGEHPGFAEITLIPQIYNARRFDMDLGAYPRLIEIDSKCMALQAFQKASPEVVNQS